MGECLCFVHKINGQLQSQCFSAGASVCWAPGFHHYNSVVVVHCRLRCTNVSMKRFNRGWWICYLNTPTSCSAAWVLYDLMCQGPRLLKAVVIQFTIHRAVPLGAIKEFVPMVPMTVSVQKSLVCFLPSLVILLTWMSLIDLGDLKIK